MHINHTTRVIQNTNDSHLTNRPRTAQTRDSKKTSFLSLFSACFRFRKTSTNEASDSTNEASEFAPTPTSEKKLTILSYLFASLKRFYLFHPSIKSTNQVLEEAIAEAIKNPDDNFAIASAIKRATPYLYDFIQYHAYHAYDPNIAKNANDLKVQKEKIQKTIDQQLPEATNYLGDLIDQIPIGTFFGQNPLNKNDIKNNIREAILNCVINYINTKRESPLFIAD